MARRPRATWLLDSADPAGAAVMAMRRHQVLRRRYDGAALVHRRAAARVPAGSLLHATSRAASLAGEVRIARSDVLITTSTETLVAAAPRLSPGTRLVHFVHTPESEVLKSYRFMRTMPRAAHVVVPRAVDAASFAAQVGLPTARVTAMDDFALTDASLLATARAKVFLAVGRIEVENTAQDLVEAFRAAAPRLPDWQLRFAGWGDGLPALAEQIERLGLGHRVFLLGARHDLAQQYLEAGIVVRIANHDANGLSVLEALTAGVPVLGNAAVPAVHRFVEHGRNGWVLDRLDIDSITAGMIEVGRDDVRAELAVGVRAAPSGALVGTQADALHDLIDAVLDSDPPHSGDLT